MSVCDNAGRLSPNMFARLVGERLMQGRVDYGDASFERPMVELLGEIREELLDVVGWLYVLWARTERRRDSHLFLAPLVDRLTSGAPAASPLVELGAQFAKVANEVMPRLLVAVDYIGPCHACGVQLFDEDSPAITDGDVYCSQCHAKREGTA